MIDKELFYQFKLSFFETMPCLHRYRWGVHHKYRETFFIRQNNNFCPPVGQVAFLKRLSRLVLFTYFVQNAGLCGSDFHMTTTSSLVC